MKSTIKSKRELNKSKFVSIYIDIMVSIIVKRTPMESTTNNYKSIIN